MALKRTYPHLTMIKDRDSQQALRLLFDRIFDLEALLTQTQADLSVAQDTISSQTTSISNMKRDINLIAMPAGEEIPTPVPGGEGGGIEVEDPGGVDDGQGASGCAANTGTGHVDPALPRNMVTAGMIICGTAAEWATLMDPVADQATLDAEAEHMIWRMIWHLNTQGFTAGRQRNPSGLISKDKVTVQIYGAYRAYDVLALNPPSDFMTSHCIQVFPADYVADGGIAD